jgi:hypothetical protein
MESVGEQVRILFKKLSLEQQIFLGGPPFSSSVDREIANFELYKKNGLPNRKRVCLGTTQSDSNNNIIGYQSTTIIRNANPTFYEHKYIQLNNTLDYVQLKKILIHPNYQGKNISSILLNDSIQLAKELNIPIVTDVSASNMRVINFLAKHDIINKYEWHTPKGTLMYRLSKNV